LSTKATDQYSGLGPTMPEVKPTVVVVGSGWASCRFMKGLDTKLYDLVWRLLGTTLCSRPSWPPPAWATCVSAIISYRIPLMIASSTIYATKQLTKVRGA
jgi:NADH dehydrogenase FAD-containing subunit